MRAALPAPPPAIQSLELPAPIGGLNALDAATHLPETDALLLYNLTAAELGQRVRLGWAEWAIGLTGASDNQVRTVMPFQGSHKNGSTDKLFACTSSGIWDVSGQGAVTAAWAPTTAYQTGSITQAASFVTNDSGKVYVCTQTGTSAGAGGPTGTGTSIADGTCVWNYVASNAAPSRLVTFSTTTGDAGYCTFTVMSTPAGRFLICCDEENGYYVWTESTATWTKPTQQTTSTWATSTAYTITTSYVLNSTNGNTYQCTQSGTSASTGTGPSGFGTGIVDGTCTWSWVPSITGVDPATFAAVCVWKSKVWFVQKDTSLAWWLPTNQIFGTATSQDFGGKMRVGGPLANLYGWSYDAGGGLDSLLVGVSTAGDVVIYQGTDPNSVATFSLFGSWSVGGVPYGRRIATDYGGELLVMSLTGVVQMSKLVVGAPATVGAGTVYETDKIAPLFNLDAQTYYSNQGWAIGMSPGDNVLLCLVPANGSGGNAKPYAMSRSKASWSIYRDLPMLSLGTWQGTAYFGTTDGRVAKITGNVDGVLFGNTNSFSSIDWSMLSGFTTGGTLAQKQVQMIQPMLETQENNPPINAEAKYNLDISEAASPVVTTTTATGNTWDTAKWDSATWGGGAYNEVAPLIGAAGLGRTVAVAVRGRATSRTSILGIGVMFTTGGLL